MHIEVAEIYRRGFERTKERLLEMKAGQNSDTTKGPDKALYNTYIPLIADHYCRGDASFAKLSLYREAAGHLASRQKCEMSVISYFSALIKAYYRAEEAPNVSSRRLSEWFVHGKIVP